MQQVRCNRRCDYATNRARLRYAIGYQRRAQFATIRAESDAPFDDCLIRESLMLIASLLSVLSMSSVSLKLRSSRSPCSLLIAHLFEYVRIGL